MARGGGDIKLPEFNFSDKLLSDRYNSIYEDARSRMLTWQLSDDKNCTILETDVENNLSSQDYGKKLKGFGFICNNVF